MENEKSAQQFPDEDDDLFLEDGDVFKPIAFGEDDLPSGDGLRPQPFDARQQESQHGDGYGSVPLAKAAGDDLKDLDSNFVFFFGNASSGKSVILSSMLYYMSVQAGVLRPKLGTPNSQKAMGLLYDFFEDIRQGIMPRRSVRDQVTRLDLVFEPNNRSKKVPPINLTFLETSGENHYEIRRGGRFHSSIDSFLRAKVPMSFIIVTSYETAHRDDTLINEFLDTLERNGRNLKVENVILVVSQWDKSDRMGVSNSDELDDFISERLRRTSQRMDTYGLSKTYYTIGKVQRLANGTERIGVLSLATAEVLSKWLYKSIVGYDIDYEGTFWERLKASFTG